MLRNLENLDGKKFTIELKTDDKGMLGRECPNDDCSGYFKVKPGTGIVEHDNLTKCPYCGTEGDSQDFATQEQIEYAKSLVMRDVQKALGQDLRMWGRDLERTSRGGFIKIKTDYKATPLPVHYYEEKELESNLICENCDLEYSVFGKFAFCPDCGVDNTLQILSVNLELVQKLLTKAKGEDDTEFQEYLLQNALEDIVSAFDSFGRNLVRLFTKNTDKSGISISFQNIIKAHERIQNEFGFDFRDGLEDDEWGRIGVNFHKRHLISHNDGIVDEIYIQMTNDTSAELGRKVIVTVDGVNEMIGSIETIAQNLQAGLANWKSLMNGEGV